MHYRTLHRGNFKQVRKERWATPLEGDHTSVLIITIETAVTTRYQRIGSSINAFARPSFSFFSSLVHLPTWTDCTATRKVVVVVSIYLFFGQFNMLGAVWHCPGHIHSHQHHVGHAAATMERAVVCLTSCYGLNPNPVIGSLLPSLCATLNVILGTDYSTSLWSWQRLAIFQLTSKHS